MIEALFTPRNEAGRAIRPVQTLRLPAYPLKTVKAFPFYSTLGTDGRTVPWLLAGSPLDLRSGVYFLVDQESSHIYIGSSTGTSQQGNVRRTIARHWQRWTRYRTGQAAGRTYPQRDLLVCVLLYSPSDARTIESWYTQEICTTYQCDNVQNVPAIESVQEAPF